VQSATQALGKQSIETVLTVLIDARQRWIDILPLSVRRQYVHVARRAPSAWHELEMAHPDVPQLDAVATLTSCLQLVEGLRLRLQAHDQPVDLRLVRTRRPTS